jgi:hypothetical protein
MRNHNNQSLSNRTLKKAHNFVCMAVGVQFQRVDEKNQLLLLQLAQSVEL